MSSYSSCSSSAKRSRRRPEIEMNYEGNPRFCFCKVGGRRLKAPKVESWTIDNPGRRFYGCRNFKTKNCEYFEWHDELMNARATVVINDLIMENQNLWDECQKMKMTESGGIETEISELWIELQQLKTLSAAESNKGRKSTRIALLFAIVSWMILFWFIFVL